MVKDLTFASLSGVNLCLYPSWGLSLPFLDWVSPRLYPWGVSHYCLASVGHPRKDGHLRRRETGHRTGTDKDRTVVDPSFHGRVPLPRVGRGGEVQGPWATWAN